MGKITNLLGRLAIRPSGPRFDIAPPAPPVEMIPSGSHFPELCMMPVDWRLDDPAVMPHRHKRLVELKADGIRGLRIPGRIFTREGTPLECALHCLPALDRLELAYREPMFFDGEYVADEGFNATLAEFKAGAGSGVLWLFDAVPMRHWLNGGGEALPLIERKERLKELAGAADSPFVGVLDHWMLDANETVAKFRELVLEGYEGVVSKNPASHYHRQRCPEWWRLKAKCTVDGKIVDVFHKDGLLRKIVVRVPGDAKPVTVGTGWSRAEGLMIVQQFTAGHTPVAEITYQLSTGVTRSVRGAVFNRLRPDKGGHA